MPGQPGVYGTLPGDVYSFAIIMQEVVIRGSPFCMLNLSAAGKNTTKQPPQQNECRITLLHRSYINFDTSYIFYGWDYSNLFGGITFLMLCELNDVCNKPRGMYPWIIEKLILLQSVVVMCQS